MVKVSIIIVTYNSKKYIDNCLNSLLKFNDIGDNLEIIIVDNSSQEVCKELFSYVRENFNPRIKLVHNERNGGYGQGNNIGIGIASGEIIGIMNPDIIHTDSLFKDVIFQFEMEKQLGMLGFKQMGGKEISFYIRQEFQRPFLNSILTKTYNKLNIFYPEKMYMSGAYFFSTKSVFEKIGFFDENLFLYCEESDLTLRLMKHDYKIKFDHRKSYIHDIDDRNDPSIQTLDRLLESTKYYCEKFGFSFKKFKSNYSRELFLKSKLLKIFGKKVDYIEKQIKYINEYY